jgi:hypothetical protein
MYFLRKKNTEFIKTVLDKFRLPTNAREPLEALLVTYSDGSKPFNDDELLLIQTTLGPACRALASDSIREEFLSHPERSDLYSTAAFGFLHAYSQNLDERYKQFVEEPKDPSGNYSKAELYKIPGLSDEMRLHSRDTSAFIQSEFDRQWQDLESGISEASKRKEQIKLMDRIIQKQAAEFFLKDNCKVLNHYANHIAQDGTWASEETLLALNRKVSGENYTADETSQNWVIVHQTPVTFKLLSNGRNLSGYKTPPEETNIVLNNEDNTHWASLIPAAYCDPASHGSNQGYSIKQSTPSLLKAVAKEFQRNWPLFFKTPETRLAEALIFIKDPDEHQSYKRVLLELFNTENTSGIINNINDATALGPDETDEAFAKRLQIAELKAFFG